MENFGYKLYAIYINEAFQLTRDAVIFNNAALFTGLTRRAYLYIKDDFFAQKINFPKTHGDFLNKVTSENLPR